MKFHSIYNEIEITLDDLQYFKNVIMKKAILKQTFNETNLPIPDVIAF